ncbi:hypothetical protein EBB07_16895 [Paenibacillaceae bacterium]|nr:hypothetical protein EBB07_16895 [Paenibacillaceae bacterium]
MKRYIYVCMLVALWYGLEVMFLANSEWYRIIARHPWSYILVDGLTFAPVLIMLIIGDRIIGQAGDGDQGPLSELDKQMEQGQEGQAGQSAVEGEAPEKDANAMSGSTVPNKDMPSNSTPSASASPSQPGPSGAGQ